jgi:predicted alpha/beta hydrolase family esterase
MKQKTILILHGINGKAGIFWQSWLAEKCREDGGKVIMPTLPDPKSPDRYEWLEAIITSLSKVSQLDNLWIVAHSLGVPSALDYLETIDKKIQGLISVGGFYKPYGLELNEEFMQVKKIRIDSIKDKVEHKYVIRSKNDPYVDQGALAELAEDFEANDFIIRDGKHFQHGRYVKEFPLINFILNNKN